MSAVAAEKDFERIPYSFFLLGEKSGIVRNDKSGTIDFINPPQGELNDYEELELLVNICGGPGQFTEEVKIPSFKTILDYEEEEKYVNRILMLTWAAQIALVLIPIALTIWLTALIL